MAQIGSLTIEMAANVARLRQDMEQARRTVDRAMKDIEGAARMAMNAIGAIGAGLSVAATVQKLVSVQREFDVLNSSLITVTGSAANAAREFAWLKEFAATTPYQLNEVTGAFTKMKAMGLDPSRGALTSYGNTASAMGKSLNQMIEAVADAATGEFERLKEFGIRASTEGDRVTFTFRGVATEVGKTAAEIEDYLMSIGEVEFAGAMAERAKTLDGALSNLGDTWDELFRTISSANAGSLIYDSVRLATNAIDDAILVIKAMTGAAGENARETGAMKFMQEAIAVVFETVAVVGTNVVYVFKQLFAEVKGLSEQAYALATGQFAEVGRIRQQMIANGEAARREIDATTERILGARAAAKQAADETARIERENGWGARRAPRWRDPSQVTGPTDEQMKAAKKAAEDAAKRQKEILDANAKAAIERLKRVDEAERAADEAIRVRQEQLARAYGERNAAALKTIGSLSDELKRQREANEEIGLTAEQVSALRIAREELALSTLEEARAEAIRKGEASGELDLLGEQIALTRKLIEARREGAAREAEVEAAKKVAEEWKRTSDQIEQGLTDSLFRAAESGVGFFRSLRTSLLGMFNNLTLRPMISAAVGGLGLGGSGAAMASGGGGGSALSSVSSLASLAGASGAFGSGISAGLFSGAGLSGSMTAAGSLLGTGTLAGGAAGAGMAIGAVAPYALAAYAAYRAIRSLTRRRVTGAGIEGTLGGDAGFEGNAFEEWRRRLGGSGRNTSALDPSMQSGIADAATAARSAVTGYAQALGLPVDALRTYTQALRIDTRDLSPEQIQQKVAEAVQAFTDGLAGTLGESLTQFGREGERASETLERLSTSLGQVNGVLGSLGQALLAVGTAGGDAASQLLERFGGADAFGSAAGTYLQAYYSDAERASLAARQVQDALAAVGLALPRTRGEFRALVEAQDLMTDSGRAAYVALLQSAGAFDQVAGYAQSAADAANQAAVAAIETAREQARAISEAWTSIGDTLLEEVRRIRGELGGDAAGDFSALLEAARGGDQTAAGRLPEAARAYLEQARGRSATGAEYAIAQAQVAAGLESVATAAQAQAVQQIAAADAMSPVLQSAAIDAVVAPAAATVTPARDAEIAALRADLAALKGSIEAGLAATAAGVNQTARVLTRWDQDSLPPAFVDANPTA